MDDVSFLAEVELISVVVEGVAEAAGVDMRRAGRATEAVLEELAASVPANVVHDVMPQLPAPLTAVLERGLRESWQPRPLSRDEFIDRLAERQGVSAEEAKRDVVAVFSALRHTVPGAEFAEIATALGADYEPLLVGAA